MDTSPRTADAGGDPVDAWAREAYRDLRRMARARLALGAGGRVVLDTAALVHASCLRRAEARPLSARDRLRFLSDAGHVMRSVLVDLVREAQAGRHSGDVPAVALATRLDDDADAEREILCVHEALETLATRDPRLAQVLEMRYFAGMTEAEIAQALRVTDRTVRRDWAEARRFLAEALA